MCSATEGHPPVVDPQKSKPLLVEAISTNGVGR